MTMTVHNTPDVPIHLVAVPELLNSSPEAPYQQLIGFPISGDVLPPNGDLVFPMAFTPTSAGTFEATLKLATDDPRNSALVIPLTCTAGP
jgi:hypothetical protein